MSLEKRRWTKRRLYQNQPILLIMRLILGAVIIQDKKLLIVRKKKHWILPGGKPEGNETDQECLIRETAEELSDTKLKNLRFYKDFIGTSAHDGDTIKLRIYFADIDGKLGKPSQEISELAWANDINGYDFHGGVSVQVIAKLRQDKYI